MSDGFDARDYDTDLPTRRFGLTEDEAVDLAAKLRRRTRTFDVHTVIGGGTDVPGWAVYFGFRLPTGHKVRAEIHDPFDTENGEADE